MKIYYFFFLGAFSKPRRHLLGIWYFSGKCIIQLLYVKFETLYYPVVMEKVEGLKGKSGQWH